MSENLRHRNKVKKAYQKARERVKSRSLIAEATGSYDAAEVLSEKYIYFCLKNKFNVFPPAEDTALMATWIDATNSGEELHTLMSSDFSQGFLMGRLLSLMEAQLEFEDDEDGEET